MGKVEFKSGLLEKSTYNKNDYVMIFDSEEADVTKTAKVSKNATLSPVYQNSVFCRLTGTQSNTGTGTIADPFLNLDYAVSQTNTYDTATATGAASNVLTGISDVDYAKFKVGQLISGIGIIIPSGTQVASLDGGATDAKQVTLTNSTGTGTVTVKLWNPKYLFVEGDGTFASSIYKQGLYIQNKAQLIGANVIMLNVDTEIPEIPYQFKNIGNITLTGTTSRIYYENTFTASNTFNHICNLDFGNSYSEGSNEAIYINRYSVLYGEYQIKSINLDVLGIGLYLRNIKHITFSGALNALLKGLHFYRINGEFYGLINTPSSINAVYAEYHAGNNSNIIFNCDIYGSIDMGSTFIYEYFNVTFNGNVKGTNVYSGSGFYGGSNTTRSATIFNGNIEASTVTNEFYTIYNTIAGNFVNNGIYAKIGSLYGNLSSSTGNVDCDFISTGNITLTGTANVTVNQSQYKSTYSWITLNVASGTQLTINNYIRCSITTLAGTLINNGQIYHQYKSGNITGILENNGCIFLTRDGQTESASYTPTLVFSTGTYRGNGSIRCDVADSKSGLIRITGEGHREFNNTRLRVSNGLSPLQILANTGTTQDIYLNTANVNVVAGTTDLAFSDTTYGSSFAPNYITKGLLIENTGL